MADPGLSPEEMAALWDAHTAAEFAEHSADAAIATMTETPELLHVPVGTGAVGKEPLRKFYAEVFIPQLPPDMSLEVISRTIGTDRLIDEFVVRFTHTIQMDWFAPGIAATGLPLVVPHVGIIAFADGKIASEHIYWDHATVLRQLGVLGAEIPAKGRTQADPLLQRRNR